MAPSSRILLKATVPQRDRVFAFRDFVVRTFEEELRSGPVLDMAGGQNWKITGVLHASLWLF